VAIPGDEHATPSVGDQALCCGWLSAASLQRLSQMISAAIAESCRVRGGWNVSP